MAKAAFKMSVFTRALCITGAVLLFAVIGFSHYYPRDYHGLIADACHKYDVSPALAHAVIFAESRYDPLAQSRAGAVGLMQLMPETAAYCAAKTGAAFDQEKLADPAYNIGLGVYYLSYLLQRFGSEPDAVNAGEGNVRRWKSQNLTEIPFFETREYVEKVMRAKRAYEVFY